MKPALLGCLSLALAGLSPGGTVEDTPAEAWRSFAGTWSAAGRRQVVAVEGGGAAVVVEVSGAVVLSSGEGLSRGFRGEAIGFDDGQGTSVGRSVWTDERGDQVFSRLKGESLRTGKRIEGTITGGTGRYAGVEGEYAFTWQYLVATAEGDNAGVIQGRAVSLEGRLRRAAASR